MGELNDKNDLQAEAGRRNIERALIEHVGKKSPPDLKERILLAARERQAGADNPLRSESSVEPRKFSGVWIAAASVIICAALAISLWERNDEPGTNTSADLNDKPSVDTNDESDTPTLPSSMIASGNSTYTRVGNEVELDQGWLLLSEGALPVLVGNNRVEEIGRTVLLAIGDYSKRKGELAAMQTEVSLLASLGDEASMVSDWKNWKCIGENLYLCYFLGGSAKVNGGYVTPG